MIAGEGVDVYQIINANAENDDECTEKQIFIAAQLKNKDSYTSTAGQSAGVAYCYMNDEWKNLMAIDCYTVKTDNTFMSVMLGLIQNPSSVTDCTESVTVYIKPQAYVEVSPSKVEVAINPDSVAEKGQTAEDLLKYDLDDFIFTISGNIDELGNEDHTFSDADGKERLFILVEENCQWWEVEKVDGKEDLFHCIHPLNDTYYYWGEDPTTLREGWIEKRCTITWLNWDGTPIKDADGNEINYTVPYGTMAEFLGTNPTKPMDEGYTYTFTGWTPALAPVTEDATYTAVYKSTPRKYTVTLKSDVEGACSFTGAGVYDYNTTATIEATMNPGYQFVGWEHDNALGMSFTTTVTGDVTYTVRTEAVATPEVIRAVQEGYYYTICMPKAMTNVQGATFWQFVGKDANSAYIEPVATPTVAGKPYLMYATTTGNVTATLEGEATITAGTNGALYGTFIDMDQAAFDAAGDNIYILIANVLHRVDGQTCNSLSAYRAYVDLDNLNPINGSMLTPNVRRVALGTNTATGVDQVQGDEVQSSKVLIDGTLYILRNGNMYDAQGKLVK